MESCLFGTRKVYSNTSWITKLTHELQKKWLQFNTQNKFRLTPLDYT